MGQALLKRAFFIFRQALLPNMEAIFRRLKADMTSIPPLIRSSSRKKEQKTLQFKVLSKRKKAFVLTKTKATPLNFTSKIRRIFLP